MISPNLDQYFPDGDTGVVTVFDTLRRVVLADPVLSGIEITWRLWDGTPGESDPPSDRQLPWARLTPVSSKMYRAEEDDWQIEFSVKFEIAVEGTRFENLGNLVGYFYRALRTNAPFEGGTVFQAFRAAGAISYEFVAAGISPYAAEVRAPEPSGDPGKRVVDLISAGMIVFQVYESSLN